MRVLRFTLISVVLATLLLAGCNRKEDNKPAGMPSPHGGAGMKESVVTLPDAVKGRWKSVKINVTDKTRGKETVYEVAIGSQLIIPNSGLTVTVDNFLPHFIMDGSSMTSQSNEPKNPAAQIRVSEGGKEIYKGWLFSLYPTIHAFQHPTYGFTLVDFVPAN